MAKIEANLQTPKPSVLATVIQGIAHLFLIGLVIAAVIITIVHLFSWPFAFISVLITMAIMLARPDLLKRLENHSSIQYYCVILLVTLMFGIESCKCELKLLLGLTLTAGVTMISMYVGSNGFLCISIFLNIFMLLQIACAFTNHLSRVHVNTRYVPYSPE